MLEPKLKVEIGDENNYHFFLCVGQCAYDEKSV